MCTLTLKGFLSVFMPFSLTMDDGQTLAGYPEDPLLSEDVEAPSVFCVHEHHLHPVSSFLLCFLHGNWLLSFREPVVLFWCFSFGGGFCLSAYLTMSRVILIVVPGMGVLLASGGWRARMLLKVWLRGQSLTTKNYQAQNVSVSQNEELWSVFLSLGNRLPSIHSGKPQMPPFISQFKNCCLAVLPL